MSQAAATSAASVSNQNDVATNGEEILVGQSTVDPSPSTDRDIQQAEGMSSADITSASTGQQPNLSEEEPALQQQQQQSSSSNWLNVSVAANSSTGNTTANITGLHPGAPSLFKFNLHCVRRSADTSSNPAHVEPESQDSAATSPGCRRRRCRSNDARLATLSADGSQNEITAHDLTMVLDVSNGRIQRWMWAILLTLSLLCLALTVVVIVLWPQMNGEDASTEVRTPGSSGVNSRCHTRSSTSDCR